MQLLSNILYKISVFIVIVCFVLMLGSILIEVFARNLLNHSFAWSGELAQYSFIWLTFIGTSAVYKRNELVGINLINDLVPIKYQKMVFHIVQLIIGVFTITLIYLGYKKAFSASVLVQYSTGLQVPMVLIYISIPIGMFILLIHVVALMFTKPDQRLGGIQ